MLIDIDIKITDNGGNLVHHFIKRLDEEDAIHLKKMNNNYCGESFEDFLSEYMSTSGYAVRDKLASTNNYCTNSLSSLLTDDNSYNGKTLSNLENKELSCNIRIGNKELFTGRIPLTSTIQVDTKDITKEKSEIENDNTTCLEQEFVAFDRMIHYAMFNAITKYEANLSFSSEEELHPIP